jgi:hypothetical protein
MREYFILVKFMATSEVTWLLELPSCQYISRLPT